MWKTKYGATPAPYTCFCKRRRDCGFCFERCNSRLLFRGSTALHCSSYQGHVEVCKVLIESDADVNVKDNECDARPLHMLFCFCKRRRDCGFCFERCNSRLLFSGQTALHRSSRTGDVEVCKLLIEGQAYLNDEDEECDARPLHMLLQTKAGLRFLL